MTLGNRGWTNLNDLLEAALCRANGCIETGRLALAADAGAAEAISETLGAANDEIVRALAAIKEFNNTVSAETDAELIALRAVAGTLQ